MILCNLKFLIFFKYKKFILIKKKKEIIDIITGSKILRALILFINETPKPLISSGSVFIAAHKTNQNEKMYKYKIFFFNVIFVIKNTYLM